MSSAFYDYQDKKKKHKGNMSSLDINMPDIVSDADTSYPLTDTYPADPTTAEQQPAAQTDEEKHTACQKAIDDEMAKLQKTADQALSLVDDVVLKNYLTKLPQLPLVKPETPQDTSEVYLMKVNKIVYEKDEYATDKFASVMSAMTFANVSVFLVLDGHGDDTDFYIGLNSHDERHTSKYLADTLRNALIGQFPGIQLENCYELTLDNQRRRQDNLLDRIAEAKTISSCVGVPSYKDKKGTYTNANFIQGIEKLANAMRGRIYTAIILASNMPASEIRNVRHGYEYIYQQLSIRETQQVSYSTNESLANALSRTRGTTEGTSTSDTEGTNHSISTGKSVNKDNKAGRIGKAVGSIGSALMTAGAVVSGTAVGLPAGLALMGIGAASTAIASVGGKQLNKNENKTDGTNESHTESTSRSESFSETDGQTSTVGETKGFTITRKDKHIQEILKRIDKQLDRIAESESTGLWSAGAYFLSYDNDRATAETAATIYRSIMQGETSGVEASAVNTWYDTQPDFPQLCSYVSTFEHPMFVYHTEVGDRDIILRPISMNSSKEMALMIGLPRKSVPGILVREQATFGHKVVAEGCDKDTFQLGHIVNLDNISPTNTVDLGINSLASHTFVTGSTGCGKSNTVYLLLHSLKQAGRQFMVIEPAKGEYKNVFGHMQDVEVYGTNPNIMTMLKINPFAFPQDIHVEEHIDRLIDIFSACWPMYAAMPAVLKKSITNAYQSCGWDLYKSESVFDVYPTFKDVIRELNTYINSSEYSSDSKGDYKGALGTRLESLTNGIVGQIFSDDLLPTQEASNEMLFNHNVIVDLSRVGSMETKALIMGVLVMRLNEFRMSEGKGMNLPLRHVTVLEEAHNLLKATSTAQSQEGSNVLGKSVEMISSSIAEMRTYGEGFIIADQSPSMLDRSAISNTNTKIIMALPNKDDRDIAAGSTSLTDQQKNEVSRLKTGVAVVFQKGWEEAVLCKIDHYNADERPYKYKKPLELPLLDADGDLDEQLANIPDDNEPQCLTKLLLAGYSGEVEPDIETLVTVLFDDRNLTGKQRYDLALRLDMISQDMDPELVNYDMEGQPHNPSDICAILFAQLVGIEAFAGISAKSKDINELNSAVLQLIREEGSTPTDNLQEALAAYIKGCCLMNTTDFFEEWMRQTYGLDEQEPEQE